MRNIKLVIEYDGTNYSGWQTQTSLKRKVKNEKLKSRKVTQKAETVRTIQETIETALQKILQKEIKLIASGRTDAGVHASCQVANFKTDSKIPLEKIRLALNSFLPKDIVIKKVEEVNDDFHSRFDAKEKTYRYAILNRYYPDPFLKNCAYFFPYKLDLVLMKSEALCLMGRHDFKCFQTVDKIERQSKRFIKEIKVYKRNNYIYIEITANGFLYNMARSIAGTLIEIGRGRFGKGSMRRILASKKRASAGPVAPANGLTLINVSYD
jgi:tRNA pseudouridine38-40 synthase